MFPVRPIVCCELQMNSITLHAYYTNKSTLNATPPKDFWHLNPIEFFQLFFLRIKSLQLGTIGEFLLAAMQPPKPQAVNNQGYPINQLVVQIQLQISCSLCFLSLI